MACGKDSVAVITQFNRAHITSPYWPNPYPPNSNCTWKITTTHDAEIKLSLKGHKLDQKYLYIRAKLYIILDSN